MRTVSQTVYTIGELSAAAMDSARSWYREHCMNYAWWDSVYEDAAQIADILGIDLRTRKLSFRDGNTRYDGINISFSGFSCQGDGAHFVGTYKFAKGAAKAIREYAPEDAVLHRIADELQAIQRKNFYRLKATVTHSDRYQHAYSTDVEVEIAEDRNGNYHYPSLETSKEVTEQLRNFMNWIYRALEKEYESSDEAVDQRLADDGTEFTEQGKRVIVIH